jgi:hypothetical protein
VINVIDFSSRFTLFAGTTEEVVDFIRQWGLRVVASSHGGAHLLVA